METEVRDAIKNGYIDAIHRKQDKKQAATVFHPSFRMFVKTDNEIQTVSLDDWFVIINRKLEKINIDPDEITTKVNFLNIDIVDDMAMVKLELFRNNSFFGTDMIFLYRIDSSWNIVTKIFQTPGVDNFAE